MTDNVFDLQLVIEITQVYIYKIKKTEDIGLRSKIGFFFMSGITNII